MKTRLALTAAAALFATAACGADLNKQIPAPASDPANTAANETAVLAGGCFWGQQGVFEHVKGVTRVVAGYTGGVAKTANYYRGSEGETGQSEALESHL